MLGNGRLEALCFDGSKRLCHIRGKLRKKVEFLYANVGGMCEHTTPRRRNKHPRVCYTTWEYHPLEYRWCVHSQDVEGVDSPAPSVVAVVLLQLGMTA